MIFKRKKKITGIFDDLPVAPEQVEIKNREVKKTGRRAMLIPDTPYNDDPGADLLLANTGKQKEVWLEILFASQVREARQAALAEYLQNNYRVQKWWANSIALMYLKWRAEAKSLSSDDRLLRLTANIPTTVGLCYNLISAESIYGSSFKRFLKLVQDEKLVVSFDDETRASITIQTEVEGCSLIIEHEFIKDAGARKSWTKFWQELTQKLISQVQR